MVRGAQFQFAKSHGLIRLTQCCGRVRGSKEGILEEDYYLSLVNKMTVTREYITKKILKGV